MRGVVKLGLILLAVLLVLGLVIPAIGKVRDAANRAQCQNNLKSIGLALQGHHDCYGHYPTGTLPNPDLPPDRRLSWLPQVWPGFMCGGVANLLDQSKAWDAEENCPPWSRHRIDMEGNTREELAGELKVFLCPANGARLGPDLPCPTHYLGITGLGEDAAELPLSDLRAGFFGYDRTVSLGDLKDGAATTLAVAEAVDGGPWTAGGRATVRGLAAGDGPYLGEGGQFAAHHRGTNVLFADAHVRPLTASVSPQVFEALATIAGDEAVGPIDPE